MHALCLAVSHVATLLAIQKICLQIFQNATHPQSIAKGSNKLCSNHGNTLNDQRFFAFQKKGTKLPNHRSQHPVLFFSLFSGARQSLRVGNGVSGAGYGNPCTTAFMRGVGVGVRLETGRTTCIIDVMGN
jgi:hypothetical protein